MDVLEQELKSAASGAIAHPRGRDKALEPLGWTGRRTGWIVLVRLHCRVFTRAQWARFMDAHPEQLRRGQHADRVGVGRRGDRAQHSRGSGARVSTSKGPMRRIDPERPRLRRTGLSDAAKAGEPGYPVSYTGAGEGLRPFEPQETRAPMEFARRGVAPLPSVAAHPDG